MPEAERKYSVPGLESLKVFWAFDLLGPYLQGEKFIVTSYHASLRFVMNINEPSDRLIRWRLRLSEYDFVVKYNKGKSNTQADALSRL